MIYATPREKLERMSIRRWVHVFALVVPVVILTTFNVIGIKPTAELAAALSALTTAAAALAGASVMRKSAEHEPPKRRSPRPKHPRPTRKKAGDHAARDLPTPKGQQPPAARHINIIGDDRASRGDPR